MYEWVFTYELMKDPYTTVSGYSYEKDHLFKYLLTNRRDPMTRVIIPYNQIYQNIALQKAITYYKDN